MELVDIYNDKHEKLNYTKGRKELTDGEYHLSSFVWIINDNDEILIQQRVFNDSKFPGMWGATAGGAKKGETRVDCILRELKEEMGINTNLEDLKFIGSYVRIYDYVEIFVLRSNIKIDELTLQEDEVQDVKWVSISEFENMINNGEGISSAFNIFKEYYEKYYNTYVTFENGKPIFRKK